MFEEHVLQLESAGVLEELGLESGHLAPPCYRDLVVMKKVGAQISGNDRFIQDT